MPNGTWKQEPDGTKQVAGDHYRIVCLINAPYSKFSVATFQAGFRLQAATHNLIVERFEDAPPLWDAHNNRPGPFTLTIYYQVERAPELVEAGLDPRVVLSILALVVGGLFALALVSKRIEHLVETVGDVTTKTLQKTVLNPGVLLLGFAALVIIYRR